MSETTKPDNVWEKYGKDSLNFVLNNLENQHNSIITAFRILTNKSQWFFGIYVATFSYFFSKVLENDSFNWQIIWILLLITVGLIIIMLNLFPARLKFDAVDYNTLSDEYFHYDDPEDDILNKRILKRKIEVINTCILHNTIVNKKRIRHIRVSSFFIFISIITYLIYLIFHKYLFELDLVWDLVMVVVLFFLYLLSYFIFCKYILFKDVKVINLFKKIKKSLLFCGK